MFNKFFNVSSVAITLTGILISQSASAAIALDRTRAVFDSEYSSISLSVSNKNKSLPYLAQAWLEDVNGQKVQSPLAVLPPVQRIEPGKESQIKIEALPAISTLPQDRETLFYFNLREIPPKSDKANTLQIALQTRIKLFYRPEAIKAVLNAAPWQEKLTMVKQNDKYTVQNPTPYYVTIVDGSTAKGKLGSEDFQPIMIEPKGSAVLTVSASQLGNTPVLTYVNDYGARPTLTFICSGNQCSVQPEKK